MALETAFIKYKLIPCLYVVFSEVLGALVSVLIIWVLTGVLVYLAVQRVITKDFEINADIMLITAGIGLGVNIL